MTQNRRRLIKDVCQIIKNPLDSQGIFYRHDDEIVNKGYCMIIGSENTPYENGIYFFKLEFPDKYPFEPPHVTFYNNDRSTRFHPNLYRNGKVCLSILNTWKGEQWTSCQNISSVLLTIASIMNDKPLLNEPGIYENHREFKIFNKFVTYKNLECSILNNLKSLEDCDSIFVPCFSKEIINHFKKNLDKIEEQVKSMKTYDKEHLIVSIYKMTCEINYNELEESFEEIKNLYNN